MAPSIFQLLITLIMSLVFGVLMLLAIGVGMALWVRLEVPVPPPGIVHPAPVVLPVPVAPNTREVGLV